MTKQLPGNRRPTLDQSPSNVVAIHSRMNSRRRRRFAIPFAFAFATGFILVCQSAVVARPNAAQPNIVICITDDQGYGDLGCHGNPVIQTPNIDALAAESVSLNDYHVAPTCSPTRAALLTGHWTNRTGVWHTIMGRSMLRANEITLAQFFKEAGYATGMFGKWHLGDNYPYRAEDRGFTEVYRHGGGGVGQTPDVWDNAYFDGAYFHNGQVEAARGFCTDVFFDQGRQFIRDCVAQNKPFLAYISTNAPHGPLHCPQKYIDKYPDQTDSIRSFYGMITNIDDNIGQTRQLLKKLGVYENTVFIFTTDNGTASGEKVFNAGMRGKKGSEYDGGHRVPFMVHWPNGGMTKQYPVNTLTHAVDVVPTLLDIAGIAPPDDVKFDGVSIKPLLESGVEGGTEPRDWPDRMLVTDSQRVRTPVKWRKSAVMTQGWRLVNGTELYHMNDDPGQSNDVADDHPERVARMRAFYDAWWAELEPTFDETTEIYLGHPDHPKVSMTAHDWIGAGPPWNQAHIRNGHNLFRRATKNDPPTLIPGRKHTGYWAIKVLASGTYDVLAMRWPSEADTPITASLPKGQEVPGASQAYRARPGLAIPAVSATLRIDGAEVASKPVVANQTGITFTTRLTEGSHQLSPVFRVEESEVGAFYVVVSKRATGDATDGATRDGGDQ